MPFLGGESGKKYFCPQERKKTLADSREKGKGKYGAVYFRQNRAITVRNDPVSMLRTKKICRFFLKKRKKHQKSVFKRLTLSESIWYHN